MGDPLQGMSKRGRELLKIRGYGLTETDCCYNCTFWGRSERGPSGDPNILTEAAPCRWSVVPVDGSPETVNQFLAPGGMRTEDHHFCCAFIPRHHRRPRLRVVK